MEGRPPGSRSAGAQSGEGGVSRGSGWFEAEGEGLPLPLLTRGLAALAERPCCAAPQEATGRLGNHQEASGTFRLELSMQGFEIFCPLEIGFPII